jgi:hypothetical protein
MTRVALAAVPAALAAAGALAWAGYELLSLPHRGSGVAASIVGGDDVRRFDAALRLFRASVNEPASPGEGFVLRARAEAALAAQHGDARVRSQAQTLLGVLALEDALAQPQTAGERAAAAADAFRNALRLDPDNEQAAVDLELLLARRGGTHGGFGPGGKRGATVGRRGAGGRGATAATASGGGY